MRKGLGFSAISSLLVLLLTAGTAMGDAGLDAGSRGRYAAACRAISSGEILEGAVELIELLRDVPGDDAAQADAFVGPSQLLGFAIASLMDWPDRTRLLSDVFKPDEYPTDQLIISTMQAGSGIQGIALPARVALEKLAKGSHQAVRAAALYILAQPYYFPGTPTQNPAIAELVLAYPELEFSQCLIEMPVYYALDEARKAGTGEKNLLGGVLYWGGRKEMVLQASPGLARAAEALPSMNLRDLDDDTVAQWAAGLADDPDPRSRYTVVSLLAKTCGDAARRARARAGLEALAQQPPETPDVLRARILLAEFARADHTPEALPPLVLGLLKLDILPCTAERSMYEAVLHAAQHAARYATRHGRHGMALQIHEALAAKYPGSTLALDEEERAEAIRADGLRASLDLIELELDAPLRNGDIARARAMYEDIIAHTPHGALRAVLQEKLERVEEDSQRLRSGMSF